MEAKQIPITTILSHINSDVNGSNESPVKETFTALELYNLNISEIPCLVGDIIPVTGIWSIVGSSDTGKSMILRQLALSIAKGSKFLNFNINARYNKVIFISTEDDNIATAKFIRKQSSSTDCLENIRFHFETDNIIEYLNRELTAEPVDLIVIDAWSDVFGQNLNDSALIRQTLIHYKSIATKYDCSIAFLHHTGKRTEKLLPSKNNILSGQGFESKMRLVIELRNDSTDENIKHLCIVKGNYLGKEYKESSFVLELDTVSFLFSNTGQRVSFDQLTENIEPSSKKKVRTQPGDIDNETHIEILRKIFKKTKQMKLGELEPAIANHFMKHCDDGYEFGKERVGKFLSHLMEQELILSEGKDRSPKKFYYMALSD